MKNEYIGLPINLQDTPNHILEKAITPSPIASDPLEAVDSLLKKIQELIKGNDDEIYMFYQTVLPKVESQHFASNPWPTPSSLEQHFDTQYKIGAQTIYNEYVLRGFLRDFKTEDEEQLLDRIDLAWETYTSIFQLEATKIQFHPLLIWDFYENFLTFYGNYENVKHRIPENKINNDWFNKQKMFEIFHNLEKYIPANFKSNPSSQQLFGYYAIIAQQFMNINEGNFNKALKTIESISFQETRIFSKGCGSILTLFFNTSFAYFVLGEYDKSIKLSETIVSFYEKYRKHFNKSILEKSLTLIHEKNVSLLCLNCIFLEEKPKGPIVDIFKNTIIKGKQTEKISDSFYKMKQNDSKTFQRLFSFIRSGFSFQNVETLMLDKFNKVQQVTLNTIVQNFKRIELKRIAEMLSISEEEVIKKMNNLHKISENTSKWDTTIMNPLLKQKKKVSVEIVDKIAIFESQNQDNAQSFREWQRYKDEVSWLIQKTQQI